MFKGFDHIFQNTYFFKHLSPEASGLLNMNSLHTNYNFTISVMHYPYLKTISKIIPLNQHKFQILNQNKEARRQLGGEYGYEQQSKSIPSCFDSSKHDAHIECYKQFTMSWNIAKRKSEKEGTSTLNNTKRVQRSLEGTKQLFPKECRISIYIADIVPTFVDPANISWCYCQIH